MQKHAVTLDNNTNVEENNTEDKIYTKQNYTKTLSTNVTYHHIYINSEIDNKEPWFSKLMELATMIPRDENDRHDLTIHMSTIGGGLYDAMQIIAAVNNANIDVRMRVYGACMSAGTIIALGGQYKTLFIDQYSVWLFHHARMLTMGKVPDIKDYLESTEALINVITDDFYRAILTEEEIDRIKHGKELYMLGREVNERIKRHLEPLEEEEASSDTHPQDDVKDASGCDLEPSKSTSEVSRRGSLFHRIKDAFRRK